MIQGMVVGNESILLAGRNYATCFGRGHVVAGATCTDLNYDIRYLFDT